MKYILIFLLTTATSICIADNKNPSAEMYTANKQGLNQKIGEVLISESSYGLVFTVALKGINPGIHGFHLHQNASCEAKQKKGKLIPALAAGGHYDPLGFNKHDTAWGNGHLGDLPSVYADESGTINQQVLAPRLKINDLKGRSLILHAGGDNYSDSPAPLGGGGARIACGIIR